MTFAHITIATRDVEGTAGFYEKTLGWKRVHAPENSPIEIAWLQIGPRQFVHVLKRDDWESSKFDTEFGRHFAVYYDGSQFAELKRRLVAQGGELINPIRPTPFERFFFKDPNGYIFEVIDEQHYVAE